MMRVFKKYKRRSIRLQGYDYSQDGAYFITICTHNRECLFGEIVVGANGIRPEIKLNEYGKIVAEEWLKTEQIRNEIQLDEWVIMPNHFHGIISIVDGYDSTNCNNIRAYGHTPLRSPSRTIGAMVRGFKSVVTKHINESRNTPTCPVWQRNYYEHIIRNENDYFVVAQYILENPLKWERDEYYPKK